MEVTDKTLIKDCDLSIRTKKLFEEAQINTIEDLLKLDINYLMRFRGFGKRSLSELRQFLVNNNLNFNNG